MRRVAKVLGILALAGIGVSTPAREVWADKRLSCRMKGTWLKAGGRGDSFEFDAIYISKDGPDTFTGRYVNPGEAEADITGAATKGTWLITLTYRDAKHRGMVKELAGKGAKDPRTHLLNVDGKYRTLIGGSDIKADGVFKLVGTCR